MICPKCEYEYIDGVKVCADCGTVLIPVEDFEGKLLHPSDWVVVSSFGDFYEAEMYKANLSGAGIETLIFTKRDRNFPLSGSWETIKLLVKKTEVDDAVAIINDIKSRTPEENTGENKNENE
jgi:hypothetical protein